LPLGLLFGFLALPVRGGDAEDHYLALFNQLRQAEQLEERGVQDEACAAFRVVQERLRQFQVSYPSWHPEVVAFRLRYLQAGVERLCPETAANPDRATPEDSTAPPAAEPLKAEDLLRARLRQLELDKIELEAKLREALAPRPATLSSPELARAEERIRNLEKEVALLRFATQSDSAEEKAAQPSTDTELALQAELQALRDELELERQKVAALEATTSALSARSVADDEAKRPRPTPATPLPSEQPIQKLDALDRGRELLRAGALDEAILVLGEGAEAPEASAELLSLLGGAFLSKGLIDPAEAVARRALAADASCAEAHRVMARLCLRRSPPARSLARWHYHESRRHGLTPDPTLEDLLSDAPTDPS
jgi:hypothetical protein